MRRVCSIILFLVFTQYLLETAQANPEPRPGDNKNTCGRHGDPCASDSQCCQNTLCHKFAKRCQVGKGDEGSTPLKELCSGPPKVAASEAVIVRSALPRSPVAVTKLQARVASKQRSSDEEPSPESQLTLREEIRLFRSELQEVRDEMREFRQAMTELHSSLGVCTKRVDDLEARIEALENKKITATVDERVVQLEHTVRISYQEILSSDLEIANMRADLKPDREPRMGAVGTGSTTGGRSSAMPPAEPIHADGALLCAYRVVLCAMNCCREHAFVAVQPQRTLDYPLTHADFI